MRYETMQGILKILVKSEHKALSVAQIRARMKRRSDEGIRKVIRQLWAEGYVVRYIEPIRKNVANPGRARHLWFISNEGRAFFWKRTA